METWYTITSLMVFTDMPSLSGVSDMDYPLQGPGLLSVPNLPELNAVRRVPLPPELVEQFSRILDVFFVCFLIKPIPLYPLSKVDCDKT